MLQALPRGVACKTRGQDGFAALLSCRALSSPTTCRFIPALSGLPTIRPVETGSWGCECYRDFRQLPNVPLRNDRVWKTSVHRDLLTIRVSSPTPESRERASEGWIHP